MDQGPLDSVPLKSIGPEHVREGAIRTQHILDGTILGSDIASGTIQSGNIQDGTIAEGDLATAVLNRLFQAGMVVAYGGTAAPTGWLMCDGTSYLRADFSALFTAIGTAYGSVDGTHFNVPDLRQRFPLGKAAAGTGSTLGGTGGAIDHTHPLDTSSSHAKVAWLTAGAGVRGLRKTVTGYNSTHSTGAASGAGAAETTGTALGGDSDTANPPFQTVNYIIKT